MNTSICDELFRAPFNLLNQLLEDIRYPVKYRKHNRLVR